MKPTFSIADALDAPFRLARHRPLTIFLWGAIFVAVMIGVYAAILPIFAEIPVGEGKGQEAFVEYTQQTQNSAMWINALTPLTWLVMLLAWTAAGRATLSPGKGDPFAFLRIGMDELRVVVVYIAWFMAWYIGLIVAALLAFAVGMAIWFVDHTAAIVVGILLGPDLAIAATWLWLRLSLIAPASLILKTFAFSEGWALTKGQAWKLLGLNLLKWLISIPMTLLLYAIVAAILAGGYFGQGLNWPQNVETLADLEPVFRAMLVPGAFALIPIAGFYGFYIALNAAPSIVAARQLLDGGSVPPAPVVADAGPGDALEAL